jgi:hypothetical protein
VKRLVLFLFLVGAAVYLLMPPGKAPEGTPEAASAAQSQIDTQVDGPLTSSPLAFEL